MTLTSLRPRELTELGRGTDSAAFLADGEWVLRFAVASEARATLRRELALLPHLAPTLPIAVPAFEHVGNVDGEPAFVGYRVLRGSPLTPGCFGALPGGAQEEALSCLAGFLRALHRFPPEEARRAGVGEELAKGAFNPLQRSLPERLVHLLSPAEVALLENQFARFEREHLPDQVPQVLLHADLKPDHVLYDSAEGRLSGVLDWGDVCLGDPDFDLAVISIFIGEPLLLRLLQHFRERDRAAVLSKTRFFRTLRWLQDLWYVNQRADQAAVTRCVEGVRAHLQSLT